MEERRPLRAPPVDPNRGQNRVPSQMEATTLRNLRSTKRQLADSTKRELDMAKQAHERIQSRYDTLLQEIEAVQSELNLSYDCLMALENHLEMFQAEDNRLSGLLHPVRRCPEDVLMLIFKWAAQIDPNNRFKFGTSASHVCKAWRSIALKTCILWNQVDVSVQKGVGALKMFMERVRERVRNALIELKILDITERNGAKLEEIMKCIQLDQLELTKLEYSIHQPNCLSFLALPAFSSPAKSVGRLNIQAFEDPGQQGIWDIAPLLRKYPTLSAVWLDDVGDIILEGDDAFPLMKVLQLTGVSMPGLARQFERFVGLEKLEINRKEFVMEGRLQDITMPNLAEMVIMSCRTFPWSRLAAPRLRYLKTDDLQNDAVRFFCRHPSLRELDDGAWMSSHNFQKIAIALPNLESVSIGGEIDGLFSKINPNCPFPPFPRMKELQTDETGDHNMSLEDFEAFVKGRCLPRQLEEQDRAVGSVSIWKIIMHVDGLERAPWRGSELLRHCSQNVTKWPSDDTVCIVVLDWREAQIVF